LIIDAVEANEFRLRQTAVKQAKAKLEAAMKANEEKQVHLDKVQILHHNAAESQPDTWTAGMQLCSLADARMQKPMTLPKTPNL
ncbi:hypothetical protein HDU93_004275, partial [Gonapodya sp. JEL0774]